VPPRAIALLAAHERDHPASNQPTGAVGIVDLDPPPF
jgi:hypothetical protein